MTEEQTNEMMLMMEQLAEDIRALTYAIREHTEVAERRERRIAPTELEEQHAARATMMKHSAVG